jgi:nicotinate phosphoribosyltransferase
MPLVTGYMPPGFVFKLVAIEDGATMRPVAKRSVGKLSIGGAKDGYRILVDGVAVTELVVARDAGVAAPPENARPLSHILVDGGDIVVASSLEQARATARAATAELPRSAFTLGAGEPALETDVVSSTRTNQ